MSTIARAYIYLPVAKRPVNFATPKVFTELEPRTQNFYIHSVQQPRIIVVTNKAKKRAETILPESALL